MCGEAAVPCDWSPTPGARVGGTDVPGTPLPAALLLQAGTRQGWPVSLGPRKLQIQRLRTDVLAAWGLLTSGGCWPACPSCPDRCVWLCLGSRSGPGVCAASSLPASCGHHDGTSLGLNSGHGPPSHLVLYSSCVHLFFCPARRNALVGSLPEAFSFTGSLGIRGFRGVGFAALPGAPSSGVCAVLSLCSREAFEPDCRFL